MIWDYFTMFARDKSGKKEKEKENMYNNVFFLCLVCEKVKGKWEN